MKLKIIPVLILILILSACSDGKTHFDITIPDIQKVFASEPEPAPSINSSNDTIAIASFKIQVFGKTKAGKPEVMSILARIIHQFDIVAIQEIRDKSGTAMEKLEAEVDALGVDYEYVTGPRLGRTESKEQYAYMYRPDRVVYVGSYTFPVAQDIFHREPFVGKFAANNGDFDFLLLNIHTNPDEATAEMNALPIAVEDAKVRFSEEKDFIVLGNLNADCPRQGNYFDENDLTSSLRSTMFTWLIDNSMDTNLAQSSCTYDRIIITEHTKEDWTGKAGVYRFDEIFDLNPDQAKKVSDHYPVWAIFHINHDSD